MKDFYINPEFSIIKFTLSDVLAPSQEIEVPDFFHFNGSGVYTPDDLENDDWKP